MSKHRELLLAEAVTSAWAIEPGHGSKLFAVLQRWSGGESASDVALAEVRASREAAAGRQSALQRSAGGAIAVLPLHGVIVQRANLISEYSGGTSCQVFSSMLKDALSDDAVAQILINIDSPGGSVFGVQELAAEIMQARAAKPIIGFVDSTCASAAYWLGACCSELYCTPGGEVGSIGVWQAHEDMSGALDLAGVKTTLISAGKFKTEGNSFGPLSLDAKDFLQSRINEYYRAFTAAVARGRGVSVDTVRSGMGQGRMLGASAALDEKMIDGVTTQDSLIASMKNKIRTGQRNTKPAASGASRLAHMQREVEILAIAAGTSSQPSELNRMRQEADALARNLK